MKSAKLLLSILSFAAVFSVAARASDDGYTVAYPASDKPGELSMEAAFHLWLPPETKTIRAIIVHQHGCGDGAENSGEKAAQDLHWQELARRHDAALLSPHYKAKGANCRLWCDPRNGSDETFLKAIADLAKMSSHPELAEAPWCLWGHSGGGFWASLMLEKHADKIVAVFCRSGAAMSAWSKGEIPEPKYPEAAFSVPIILNSGLKERGDKQFNGAWLTSTQFFNFFRSKSAPAAFAPDPFSSHDCRNSRLLAIPFFDSCLTLRLPKNGRQLLPLPKAGLFAGNWETGAVEPIKGGSAPEDRSILPDQKTASAFSEYTRKGITTDFTAPRNAPAITSIMRGTEGQIVIEWSARADFESGIRQFAIYRDGKLLALFPEEPKDPTGFAQFQTLSYHDTPTPGAPALRFVDDKAPANAKPEYQIATVNGAGLESKKSKPVQLK
jgi:hypothetical protein